MNKKYPGYNEDDTFWDDFQRRNGQMTNREFFTSNGKGGFYEGMEWRGDEWVPADEQIHAIREMYRVTKQNGKGVVVYDWYKYSQWMNVSLLPFRAFEFFKNKFRRLFKITEEYGLYFYVHDLKYLRANLGLGFDVKCWRSISVPFMKVYIHKYLFGKYLLDLIWKFEEKNQEKCGLNGEYPMFTFHKD